MTLKMKLPDVDKAKKYFENKMAFTTGPAELKYFMDEGESPCILDVRSRSDFEKGHIPGAVNLPEEEWNRITKDHKKDQVHVVYCYSVVCHLAARAALYFASKGIPVVELEGGFDYWKEYGYEIEHGIEKKEAA